MKRETASDAVVVVHGGAGRDIQPGREGGNADRERACREGLASALRIGYAVWQQGGSALDAVTATVRTLEDDPNFNAGRGATLSAAGHAELDASLMDGATLGAGAVAGVMTVRNPILLARAVMERSPFVFMVAPGAEEFADTLPDIERVPNDYFITPGRRAQWERLRETGGYSVTAALPQSPTSENKMGTVGAAARDRDGNLAAGTSTGGMGGKRFGRVGDSPIIAAGTWAENATCAVSCTGHGEFFIRHAVAYDIAARMAYSGLPVTEAAAATLGRVTTAGGDGGLVALDVMGNAVLPFNTPGMYRGYVTASGEIRVAIYADEELAEPL